MFALNLGAFKYQALSDVPPVRQSYNKLTFYGESQLDTIWVKNEELTNAAILAQDDVPTWDTKTVLLAKFENTLEAGYYDTMTIAVTGYVVRRKALGELFLADNMNTLLVDGGDDYLIVETDTPDTSLATKLTTITDADITTFTDYTPLNNMIYTYIVYPIGTTAGGDIEGAGIEGLGFVSFWGYMLQDAIESPSTVYYFELENQSEEIQTNKDVTVYKNFTQYPAVRYGSAEYRSGSLQSVPAETINDDGTILFTEGYLDDMLTYLNNGTSKYLRTPSGKIFKVATMNARYKYFDNIATEEATQPVTIRFDWVEVGAAT